MAMSESEKLEPFPSRNRSAARCLKWPGVPPPETQVRRTLNLSNRSASGRPGFSAARGRATPWLRVSSQKDPAAISLLREFLRQRATMPRSPHRNKYKPQGWCAPRPEGLGKEAIRCIATDLLGGEAYDDSRRPFPSGRSTNCSSSPPTSPTVWPGLLLGRGKVSSAESFGYDHIAFVAPGGDPPECGGEGPRTLPAQRAVEGSSKAGRFARPANH